MKKPTLGAHEFLPQGHAVAEAFASAIRARRLELSLGQETVAQLAGVDRSYFGRLERAGSQPSVAVFIRVASALSTTPPELMQDVLDRMLSDAFVNAGDV